jgi:hypothetical protein
MAVVYWSISRSLHSNASTRNNIVHFQSNFVTRLMSNTTVRIHHEIWRVLQLVLTFLHRWLHCVTGMHRLNFWLNLIQNIRRVDVSLTISYLKEFAIMILVKFKCNTVFYISFSNWLESPRCWDLTVDWVERNSSKIINSISSNSIKHFPAFKPQVSHKRCNEVAFLPPELLEYCRIWCSHSGSYEDFCLMFANCFSLVSRLSYSLTLMIDTMDSSEISVDFQLTTQCYMPENRTLFVYCFI